MIETVPMSPSCSGDHTGKAVQNPRPGVGVDQQTMTMYSPYRSYHLNVSANVMAALTRRDLLACSAAMLGARGLWAAKSRITKSRISAITDEIGRTQTGRHRICESSHGLQWVELRNVPGNKERIRLSDRAGAEALRR